MGQTGRMRAALNRAFVLLPAIGLGACGFAGLLRLTVRDRLPVFSTIFYATPPIVLSAVALASGALWLLRRRWTPGAISIGCAALFALWQAGASYVRNPGGGGSDGVLVLLWNVGASADGRMTEIFARGDPDLACFVEAGSPAPRRREFWEKALAGRELRWLPGEMLLAVRGTISGIVPHRLDGGWAVVARVTVRDRPLTVIAVDFPSSPLRPRNGAFRRLDELIAAERPDVVLGDFNTPRDSALFGSLRDGYAHAFEAAGSGFDGTWHRRLPILAIDHVWCAPSVRVVSCRLESSGASDHRAVLAELAPAARGR